MKTIIYLYIILFGIATQAQSYRLDTEASTLNWTGKAAFNAYALSGTLKAKLGNLTVKNDSITALNLVVDMLSLDHENNDLKSHLRSNDFFDVKKYKEAQFLLTTTSAIKQDEASIGGSMIIKDKTKVEFITVKLSKEGARLKLSFKTKLNRLDYGVSYNSPSIFKKLKQNAIADEFILEGELIFVAR